MDFLTFCQSHGIIIHDYPPVGVWKRYPTQDHPKKRNGAVKFLGDVGFVQNHATSTVVSVWKPDSRERRASDLPSISELLKRQKMAEAEQRKQQQEAVTRAVSMLNQSEFLMHPYLAAKGFPKEVGHVYHLNGKKILLIPMRAGGSLVGLQQIDEDGVKKFLYGQKSGMATFCFDNKGTNILCEGYATALSVRFCMQQLKARYRIHVCFSAGNMAKVADTLEPGLLIADNDVSGTGERVAREIGWPYWISPVVGEDFNDFHQRVGAFQAQQSLTQLMRELSIVRGHQL